MVQVGLTASGQHAWSRYTTAHNADNSQTSGSVASCSPRTTPCGDYVAVVLDGDVISVPVTLSPITGRFTQISANFTATSARALAASLSTDALATPLRTESVVTVH